MYNKLIENFLSKEECDTIIKIGESTNLQRLKSVKQNDDSSYTLSTNEDSFHKRSGSYLKDDELNIPEINSVINKTLSFLKDNPPFKGIEYDSVRALTFNKYVEGDFLKNHADKHEIEFGATLTIIYQLNDDYEGGDVVYEMEQQEYTLPKKQGSIFLFEPNIEHGVLKLLKGTRYSLNMWPTSKIPQKSLF